MGVDLLWYLALCGFGLGFGPLDFVCSIVVVGYLIFGHNCWQLFVHSWCGQNIIWQWCNAVFIILEHELYCLLRFTGFIRVLPFGIIRSSNVDVLKLYSFLSIF